MRPRHQNKELEAVLSRAEAHRWTVDKGNGYFRLRCPCGKHLKWVALTPSGANYTKNLTKWLERQPCWGGGDAA